jgi:RNA polymerase sigma-70 factor (ECF subfamily)
MSDQNVLALADLALTAAPAVQATPALIERCLGGDEGAYALLYQQHSPMVFRLCLSLLGDRQDAEEVLQDSFEYAFRRLAHYDPRKSAFTTWLYRIAVSRCRNKRRRKWLPALSFSDPGREEVVDHQAAPPDELVALDERQRRVWQALRALSPKLRETAVLRYYYVLQYSEIGEILGIPAKTAESRMRLAHRALRELLSEEVQP